MAAHFASIISSASVGCTTAVTSNVDFELSLRSPCGTTSGFKQSASCELGEKPNGETVAGGSQCLSVMDPQTEDSQFWSTAAASESPMHWSLGPSVALGAPQIMGLAPSTAIIDR